MNLLVLANAVEEVEAVQTTAMLLQRAALRGHDAWLCGVGDLEVGPSGHLEARARRVDGAGAIGAGAVLREGDLDALLLRTNPARDPQRQGLHEAALTLASFAAERGLVVLNGPVGLLRAASKAYLSALPASCRPITFISRDVGALLRFIEEAPDRVVLKPLKGTRGTDVFLVSRHARSNLRQIIDVVSREGLAMAQHYVPEAPQGDIRLVLLEGDLLEVGGRAAAVRRIPPQSGDFRSNVHIGGSPAPVEVTPAMRRVVAAVGPRLRADGLFLVGLDLIGEVVVEVNVFSPGGLHDAERFYDRDFLAPVLEALEARVERCPPPEGDRGA